MTPEQVASAGTEHAHQCAVFCWAQQYQKKNSINEITKALRWMYAIPNGGERSRSQAGRMVAEGVKSGVSDMCLPTASRGYAGFYLEMKREDGGSGESDKQIEFGEYIKTQNYFYRCCHGWEDAVRYIKWYLNMENENV